MLEGHVRKAVCLVAISVAIGYATALICLYPYDTDTHLLDILRAGAFCVVGGAAFLINLVGLTDPFGVLLSILLRVAVWSLLPLLPWRLRFVCILEVSLSLLSGAVGFTLIRAAQRF